MNKYFLSFFCIFFFTLCIFVPASRALESDAMGIYPVKWDQRNPITKSWFIYSLDINETKTDSVVVLNNSDIPLEIKIYSVDAKTTQDGAFSPLLEEEKKQYVGAWIKVSTNEAILQPHQQQEISFTISIPYNAPVGDHAGAIIIEKKELEKSQQGAININIKQRLGVRVYESIPGKKKIDFHINHFYFHKLDKNYAFFFNTSNNGNIILNPHISIEIYHIWGQLFSQINNIPIGSIFPKETIQSPIAWKDSPPFGIFRAQATVETMNHKQIASTWVIIFPWWLAIISGFILAIPAFYIIKRFVHSEHFRSLIRIGNNDLSYSHKQTFVRNLALIIIAGIIMIHSLFRLYSTWRVSTLTTTPPTQTPLQKKPSISPFGKKDIPLIILNESGITGLAKKTATTLEQKGYSITRSDNGVTSERIHTVVLFNKESLKMHAEVIVTDLESLYTSPSAEFNSQQKESIVILIGADTK